jgi:phage N-6-adenine-methyltransferase
MVRASTGKDSKQDYGTPPELIDAVERRFGQIGFDLAASASNAQTGRYFDEAQDALRYDWSDIKLQNGEILWLNPPFANIMPWIAHAMALQNRLRHPIVILVPASVGARWFEKCWEKVIVIFLTGRPTFIGCDHPYGRDMMLLIVSKWGHSIQTWDWRK